MRNERGTAVLQATLILPLVALVTMTLIDLGRAYMTSSQVKSAARAGAEYAAQHPGLQYQGPAGSPCAGTNNAVSQARKAAGSAGDSFTVTVTPLAGTNGCSPASPPVPPGGRISVTVTSPFDVLTPFLSAVVGPTTIQSTATEAVR